MNDQIHSWYKCMDCGAVFYTPAKYRESEEMYGAIRTFTVFGCPHCAGQFTEFIPNEDE